MTYLTPEPLEQSASFASSADQQYAGLHFGFTEASTNNQSLARAAATDPQWQQQLQATFNALNYAEGKI